MKPGLLTISALALDVSPEKIAEVLATNAANFLGAGGVVTLAEWATLSTEEQRALNLASRALAVENARTLAREILRAQLDPNALLNPAPDEKPAETGAPK